MTVKDLRNFLESCEDADKVTLVVDEGDNPNGGQHQVKKYLESHLAKMSLGFVCSQNKEG